MRVSVIMRTIETIDLPALDFLGIGAEATDVVIADLEDGAERAAVLAGVAVHADVVFAAIFGVSVAAEGAGRDVGVLRAAESASDFC